MSWSEISSPDGSRASDAPPSSGMSSSLKDYCVRPDLMKGCSSSALLKPGRGAVFFRAFSFVPILRDLLAIITV